MFDDNLLLEIMNNQNWVIPLKYPLILDSKLVNPEKIQLYLRVIQYINQNGYCICGHPLESKVELHHALISRKDAMGLDNSELIHSVYNTLLLHTHCHKNINRAISLIMLSNIFGLESIRKYYQEVKSQMKGKGFRNVEGLFPK